jgi:YceI-like domain
VSIHSGVHRLGPANASLSVHTKRVGAAAKAGHDLVIGVTSWEATLALAENPAETRLELSADASSLRAREGSGGMQDLGDEDRASIDQTIDDEILIGQPIEYRSTRVQGAPEGSGIRVEGDLTLVGETQPITFELAIGDDGTLSATAIVKQSAWGIKPYSTLFGALKVTDEVEVVLEGHLSRR